MIDSFAEDQEVILRELFWKFTGAIVTLAVVLATMLFLL